MKSNEQFISEVKKLNKEIICKESYRGTNIPILFECVKGHQFKRTPNNFLYKSSICPKCRISPKRKTDEIFKNEIRKKVGDDYQPCSSYVNNKTKVTFIHNKCNTTFDRYPKDFIKNPSCPKCNRFSRLKDTDTFKKEVYDKVGSEYEVLSNYINSSTKIKILHTNCLNEYEVTPNNFLNKNRRCPKCNRNYKKTSKEFEEELQNYLGKDYTLLSDYKNNKTKVLIKHNKCNLEYYIRPVDILHPNSHGNSLVKRICPKCSNHNMKSSYEDDILKVIKETYKGIKYTINDRSIIHPKEIDIYLPDYNIGIEFNGLYWHSNLFKDDTYHFNKFKDCLDKGVYLYQIYEDEWIYNREDVINKIKRYISGIIFENTENLPEYLILPADNLEYLKYIKLGYCIDKFIEPTPKSLDNSRQKRIEYNSEESLYICDSGLIKLKKPNSLI